jgi:hypothetical protein
MQLQAGIEVAGGGWRMADHWRPVNRALAFKLHVTRAMGTWSKRFLAFGRIARKKLPRSTGKKLHGWAKTANLPCIHLDRHVLFSLSSSCNFEACSVLLAGDYLRASLLRGPHYMEAVAISF